MISGISSARRVLRLMTIQPVTALAKTLSRQVMKVAATLKSLHRQGPGLDRHPTGFVVIENRLAEFREGVSKSIQVLRKTREAARQLVSGRA